jgi:hypothetical protein
MLHIDLIACYELSHYLSAGTRKTATNLEAAFVGNGTFHERPQTVFQTAFHLKMHESHVTRHTSYVTRHKSFVTRHTSQVIRHTSHLTLINVPVPKHQFYKPFLGILFRDERLGGGLLLGRALLLFLNFFHQLWNSLFDLTAIHVRIS